MIDLNNYYYHYTNFSYIPSILKYGLLNRENQLKHNIDNFTSKDDFIDLKSTNALKYISLSKYNSLSYYLNDLSKVILIIKVKPKDLIDGYLEGEIMTKNSISPEDIKGIGIDIKRLNLKRYNKQTYEYIRNLKKLNETLKITNYNLNTGKIITNKTLSKLYNYLDIPKEFNILLLSSKLCGLKEVSNFIETTYNIKPYTLDNQTSKYDLIIQLDSSINKYINSYNNIPSKLKEVIKEDEMLNKIWKKYSNYYRIKAEDKVEDKLENIRKIIDKYI